MSPEKTLVPLLSKTVCVPAAVIRSTFGSLNLAPGIHAIAVTPGIDRHLVSAYLQPNLLVGPFRLESTPLFEIQPHRDHILATR